MQKSHQDIYFDVGCLIFVCELAPNENAEMGTKIHVYTR